MEKSINSRYYLDYNATSPLSKRVKNFLQSGDFIFGNPSSVHSTGKKSKKYINETLDYIYNIFGLSPNEYSIVFNSGATEGINTFFKGQALHQFKNKKKCSFFFSTVDHSSVVNLEEDLRAFGHDVFFFGVDKNGEFDHEKLVNQIQEKVKNGNLAYLNYTYINNETGLVWPLEDALNIKKMTGVIVHVDAVQLVGKIANWNSLLSGLDAYTFSGHKFGAMKSVGFTILSQKLPFSPWIVGGGQQSGLRAGTENALGIYSIKLALMDIIDEFNPDELRLAKENIEKLLQEMSLVVGSNAKNRNLNTIFAVFKGKKSTDLNTSFDLHNIDVSMGSACSSGLVQENRILLSMGYSSEESLSAIRFSFSPLLTLVAAQEICLAIKKVKI